MRKLIYVLSLVSCAVTAFSQSTYFKGIKLFDNPFATGFVLKADSMNFYMSSKTLCTSMAQDSFTCLAVSKHNEFGDVIWEKSFPWSSAANDRSIVLRNDSVFVSGHIIPNVTNKSFNILILNSNGDSLLGKTFADDREDFKGFYNNGLALWENQLLLYGQTSTTLENFGVCVIQKYDFQKNYDTLWLYYPEFGEYFPGWDMAIDDQGALVILNEVYRIPPDLSTSRELLKVDINGNILKRINGPNYGNRSDVSNQFLILENGTYLFTHNISHFDGSDIPQLVNVDTSGEILWTHDFPQYWFFDTIGITGISELTLARNGDVIIAGSRARREKLGNGNDIFLMKMNPHGDVLWQRFYNTASDFANNKFHYRYTSDVQELADGSILVMGGALHDDNIVLLRVDEHGCLEGYNCNEDILLSSTQVDPSNPFLNYPNFYPNPTEGKSSITFNNLMSGEYAVYNGSGQMMFYTTFTNLNGIELDFASYPDDVYFVQFATDGGFFVKKVLKL